jgi:hypothetical protein
MDSEIFQGSFFNEFLSSVEQFLKSLNLPRKANFIIDNAPSHPDEAELSSRDITVIFLPLLSAYEPGCA